MKLFVQAALDYDFAEPTDVLLQVEAAALPEQRIEDAVFELSPSAQHTRVTGHDEVGERVWLQASGRLSLTYQAAVTIERSAVDLTGLAASAPREMPGETVEYLLPSRYCP